MYHAPIDDLISTLNAIESMALYSGPEAAGGTHGSDFDRDTQLAILDAAGRFAEAQIADLAHRTDLIFPILRSGRVTMPPGWQELYRGWSAAGWMGLGVDAAIGGQGAPHHLAAAVTEIWNGASPALGIAVSLTAGAIEALRTHGSADLQARYLPKLVSGEWMGTMNLTEAHAGTDLSQLTTTADPQDDGSFRLFGQKIFITFGDHDLTENIIHLVLARLPGAPSGNRGLSLFLCPAQLVDAAGQAGSRNHIQVLKLEHKIGLHASPTCVMQFGEQTGAVGYLIGEANGGLPAMFTMMNAARLLVGVQGTAVADAAYQLARNYAATRLQGRATSWQKDGSAPIIHHPDVQEMLLTMSALSRAARLVNLTAAYAIEQARTSDEPYWHTRADLLTPLAKAYPSDMGEEVASLGIQVHGGAGYIEASGAGRLWRDARLFRIYEGTNGIQALDLLQRKLITNGPGGISMLLEELAALLNAETVDQHPALDRVRLLCRSALDDLRTATDLQRLRLSNNALDVARAGATTYLRLLAEVMAGCQLSWVAAAKGDDADWLATAQHFAVSRVSQSSRHLQAITHTGQSLALADWTS